jgi:hypothetical protein
VEEWRGEVEEVEEVEAMESRGLQQVRGVGW